VNLRKKLVAAAAGLLLAGLALGAGGTSTAKPAPNQVTTTTTGY
jgi:ABC-type glycerol-3-phosphate transport system substrate-binding protein